MAAKPPFLRLCEMPQEAEKLRAHARHCQELAATTVDPANAKALFEMAEELEGAAEELDKNPDKSVPESFSPR